MRILDRYIARELLTPFLFGVAMFTAIFMGASVLAELAKLAIAGGAMLEILWIFILSLPQVAVVTFPMAMLLATLLGMTRLSSELEVVAALASGISLRRMAAPVFGAAVAVALFDFAFSEVVVPGCQAARNRAVDRIKQQGGLVSDDALTIAVPSDGPPRLVAVADKVKLSMRQGSGREDEGTLYNVNVVYRNAAGLAEIVVNAREAYWVPKLGLWRLVEASYWQIPRLDAGRAGSSGLQQVPAGLRIEENLVDLGKEPEELRERMKRPDELTVSQLREVIASRRQSGMGVARYEVALHHRFSVPFAAVVFAVIGVPLGLRRQRTGSSLGLGISVLIIFVYYILWHWLGTMGKGGALDPLAAAWIPNVIGMVAGVTLMQRAPK
ncbi:MAG: YjgP/YjgQ family permease [Armatimonadetes bacterium]|nr:YjgP/YjgQ family permease [Armatimonadota bacterium]